MAGAKWALLSLALLPPILGELGKHECPLSDLCDTRHSDGSCVVTSDKIFDRSSEHQAKQCRFTSNASLVMVGNITVGCNSPCFKEMDCACSITFSFDAGIDIGAHVHVMAGSLKLKSEKGMVRVGQGAVVEANGMGRCGFDAKGSGFALSGAGHGGFGGACLGVIGKSGGRVGEAYGDGTAPWKLQLGLGEQTLYGSGTTYSNLVVDPIPKCCGGGYVLLNASLGVQLDGSLSADAQAPCDVCLPGPSPHPGALPCCDSARYSRGGGCSGLGGASGGTVVVAAGPKAPLALNGTGRVSAKGGVGTQHTDSLGNVLPTAGGAGGRVELPMCTDDVTVNIGGGDHSKQEPGQCDAGAAGSIWYLDCGAGMSRLILDNEGTPTSARSNVGAVPGWQQAHPVDELYITNGALLAEDQHRNVTATAKLVLKESARVHLHYGQAIIVPQLQLTSSAIVGESALRRRSLYSSDYPGAPPGGLTHPMLMVDTLEMGTLSQITELGLMEIRSSARVSGTIKSSAPLLVNVSQLITILPLGSLAATVLNLTANHLRLLGKVQSTASVPPTCAAYQLDCLNTTTYAMREPGCGYPLLLDIEQLEIGKGGVVASAAMRICATQVSVDSGLLTTSALGHPAGNGMGPGCVGAAPGGSQNIGAGSGASHGGNGGASGSFANVSQCKGGVSYDDPVSPGDMGSGGGGANGGSGGGVLHLVATESLDVRNGGALTADGQGAYPSARDASRPPGGMFLEGGSGGGSGGTIVIQTGEISIDAESAIHADGGVGITPGGGGGGGGRVHLQPLPESPSWVVPPSTDLYYRISAKGGAGGAASGPSPNNTGAGTDGDGSPFTGLNCSAGSFGPLCEECAAGTAKPGRGSQHCDPCAVGHHADQRGAAECDACSPGEYAEIPGSTDCRLCGPGSATERNGSTTCPPCKPGTFAFGDGAHVCLRCDKGKYAVTGASNCSICEFNERALDDATGCEPCPNQQNEHAVYTGPANSCDWVCLSPRWRSFDGERCEMLMELLLPEKVGGSFLLFIPALVAALLLLFALCFGRSSAARLRAKRRAGAAAAPPASGEGSPAFGSGRASPQYGAPMPRGGAYSPSYGRDPLLKPAQQAAAGGRLLPQGYSTSREEGRPTLGPSTTRGVRIESLAQALMWETHKYRAKQHVLRVHLTGRNSAMHPWRLPPLNAELRRLVSESAYYSFAEQVAAATQWRPWELFLLGVLWAMPPLAILMLRRRRMTHYLRVQRLVNTLSQGPLADTLWKSIHTRVWEAHRLELGSCDSHIFGWVDIFANVSSLLPAQPPQQEPGGMGRNRPPSRNEGGGPARRLSRDDLPNVANTSPYPLLQPGDARSEAPTPDRRQSQAAAGDEADGQRSRRSLMLNAIGGDAAWPAPVHAAWPGPAPPPAAAPPPVLPLSGEPGSLNPSPWLADGRDSAISVLSGRQTPVGGFGGFGMRSRSDSAERAESPTPSGFEPRVTHSLHICGLGSYLWPYWLELSDFLVYDALSSLIDVSGVALVACLNARLRSVVRYSRGWRSALHSTLRLIEAINKQQAEAHAAAGPPDPAIRGSSEPPAIALVHRHLPSPQAHRSLILQIGRGSPSEWVQPEGATLLRSEMTTEELQLPGFFDRHPLFDAASNLLFGVVRPAVRPCLPYITLVLLVVAEVFISTFIFMGLCLLPEREGYCAATLLVTPLAIILSPAAAIIMLVHVGVVLRGASKGRESAVSLASSGRTVQRLHIGAVWNAASLPNALIALVEFIPLGSQEPTLYRQAQLWALPLVFIVTKLLVAQAIKVLSASVAAEGAWEMLEALEAEDDEEAAEPEPPPAAPEEPAMAAPDPPAAAEDSPQRPAADDEDAASYASADSMEAFPRARDYSG